MEKPGDGRRSPDRSATAKSTVLSVEEEAVIVAFRRYTFLPLDDCLYALQPTIPSLTRSSLHRCRKRHGISQLPDVEGNKPAKKKFKTYPIGYFHIDIAEVRTKQGMLHLFVVIDRTSKFAFVELHEKAATAIAADFLRHLIAAVPYKIHTVLTDNGIQFTIRGAGGSAVRESLMTLRRSRSSSCCSAFSCPLARERMLRVGGKLLDPFAQHVLVHVQIARRLRCRYAALTYQLHGFELESPIKPSPSHLLPPVPSST